MYSVVIYFSFKNLNFFAFFILWVGEFDVWKRQFFPGFFFSLFFFFQVFDIQMLTTCVPKNSKNSNRIYSMGEKNNFQKLSQFFI